MGIISVTIPPVAANPNSGGGGGGASKFVQLTDVTPAADNSGKFLSEVAPVNGERRFEFLPLTTANVAGLSAALGNVSSTLSALTDEIAAEALARAEGDAQAAELAGAALQDAIVTEAQSRIAGDANLQTAIDGKEPTIASGTIAQYIRGNKSLSDFKADVLATALSGLVFTTNVAIDATDTILAAFGKLQAQVDKRLRFDASQTLTATEQKQLRTNMGTAAGLQFFDEVASIGSSRTLKPKLNGSETASTRIDLRLLTQALGGFILDAAATVGLRSIDLQLDRASPSNAVTGIGSTAIGRGWKITGIDNTGIGQILNGLITIMGQKNTVLGATGPFTTSGVATIAGDYNSILSAEIPSVSGTFNWILANTYNGVANYGKDNSLIMGALPLNQANGAVVTGNRFAQFNCRYMTNVVADMIAVSDSAVVRLRTLKNQSNPVSGTYYTLTSDTLNLVSAASTTQNGYVILTTSSHKAVFNVVIQGRITSSGGLIAHRTWQANGVFDNNGNTKYSLSQIGDATNGESILDTDIEVRIVVSTGRVVVEARTQNASATGLNVSALMTVNEIIIA